MSKTTTTLPVLFFILWTFCAKAEINYLKLDTAKNNFLVHITAFADKREVDFFPDLKNISYKEDNKGIWHYYLGAFNTLEEADSAKSSIVKLGYNYAYVIDVEKVRKECKVQCRSDEAGLATTPFIMKKVRSLSHLLFEFNSVVLSYKSKQLLQTLNEILSENQNYKVEFKGHTDAVGTPEYNQELSEKRSEVSAKFLKKAGISAERIKENSYGMEAPVAKNTVNGKDCPEGRKYNRRVEIFITDKSGNVLNALVEPFDIPMDILYAGR